jgi:putative copper export protein
MLTPDLDTIRIFAHLLAVAVWVGGQIVVAGIIPSLRRTYPDATKVVAQAFARVAWPAFAVALVTGVWSLAVIDVTDTSSTWQVTLLLKIALAIASGAAAAAHAVGTSRAMIAIGGALGLLTALGATLTGVLLSAA